VVQERVRQVPGGDAGDLAGTHVLGEQLGRLEAAGLPAGSLGRGAGAGSQSIGTSDRGWHARSLPSSPYGHQLSRGHHKARNP
jgi:hypothetical protein